MITRLAIITTLLPAMAFAQAQPFNAPTGFALYSNFAGSGATPPHEVLDGQTVPGANYSIIASAQPGSIGAFPPFASNGPGEWISSAAWGDVQVDAPDGTAWSVTLEQDGAAATCVRPNGLPAEYDMDVSANRLAINPDYKSKTDFPPLDKLASLTMAGTVAVNDASPSPGTTPCRINHAGANVGAVFIDQAVTPPQTLWYGISVAHICAPDPQFDPDLPYRRCLAAKPRTSWYWTGTGDAVAKNAAGAFTMLNYGIGDPPAAYNQAEATSADATPLSFDMLPRVTNLISSGAHGIDPNLSHWRLAATSFGQSLWGRTWLSTTWTGFVPTWTLKP